MTASRLVRDTTEVIASGTDGANQAAHKRISQDGILTAAVIDTVTEGVNLTHGATYVVGWLYHGSRSAENIGVALIADYLSATYLPSWEGRKPVKSGDHIQVQVRSFTSMDVRLRWEQEVEIP